MCVCVCVQSYLTLCNCMDCSPPGSSLHGIFQAIIVEWAAMSCSRGSSQLRDWTQVSRIGRQILYHCVTYPRQKQRGWRGGGELAGTRSSMCSDTASHSSLISISKPSNAQTLLVERSTIPVCLRLGGGCGEAWVLECGTFSAKTRKGLVKSGWASQSSCVLSLFS